MENAIFTVIVFAVIKKQEGEDSGEKKQKIVWSQSCNLFIMLRRVCLYEVYITTLQS